MNKEINLNESFEPLFQMGEAPYVFKFVWSVGLDDKPDCCSGKCDHCGTKIKNHFIIEDKNNKQFAVGSSCIEKIGDLINKNEAEEAEKSRKQKVAEKKRNAIKLLKEQEKLEQRRIAEENHKIELERQRKKNGGKTDFEVYLDIKEEKRKKIAEARKQLYNPILKDLDVLMKSRKTYNGFVVDMLRMIGDGDKLSKGQLKYIITIMNKSNYYWKMDEKHAKKQECLYWEIEEKVLQLEKEDEFA